MKNKIILFLLITFSLLLSCNKTEVSQPAVTYDMVAANPSLLRNIRSIDISQYVKPSKYKSDFPILKPKASLEQRDACSDWLQYFGMSDCCNTQTYVYASSLQCKIGVDWYTKSCSSNNYGFYVYIFKKNGSGVFVQYSSYSVSSIQKCYQYNWNYVELPVPSGDYLIIWNVWNPSTYAQCDSWGTPSFNATSPFTINCTE